MKKTVLILSFILSHIMVVAQIRENIDISIENIEIENNGIYSLIKYGNISYTDSVGYPNIPAVHKSYAIPVDATNINLEIESCIIDTLPGSYLIYPVQPPQISDSFYENLFVNPDSIIYNQNMPFPNITAQILSDEKIMGYRVINIAYYPFVYLPKSKTLYKRSISCSLNYTSIDNSLFYAPKISERRAEIARSFIISLVENKDDVINMNKSLLLQKMAVDPCLSMLKNITPDYIIITNDSLKDEFQKLADWKIKKGVPTIIKTIEEIKSEYIGSDLIEKTRSYIQDISEKWDGNAFFLLLGGDSEIIPTRKVKSSSNSERNLYAVDACYVDNYFTFNIATNSCTSSDSRSVFMGRLPINSAEEVRQYISKLINYEKANISIDYSYINNMLVSSAYLGKNNLNGYMTKFDKYRVDHLPEYVNYWYLFDHFNCTLNDHETELYDGTYGAELNKDNFLSALKYGTIQGFPHLIYHEDHGNPTSFGISSMNKRQEITKFDLETVQDSSHLNIILTGSCNTANFTDDCIGENFLKRNTISYIGNTDVGFQSEYYLMDTLLTKLYSKNVTLNKTFNIGYIHLQLLRNAANPKYRLHLLGDPEMPVWTNIPQNLNVTITPNSIEAGANIITVQINNLPEDEEALVCLMKDNEAYTTLTVTDTNPHTFSFTPKTSGHIDVTVTAHKMIGMEFAFI